ncbi:hypothetical protein [Aeromicrobium wangtongii]|uniref:Uncharacterized protein n=1 Tax=Aeromicrobium wangtongii TaxID=2969247 RepID=A0ABY5M324_9ACTN|nr:hypothetical protein [Aeromicrobium wangtongii]MCD9198575.1 hypothetical protein [Aeromicrobium wangtongii]UUP12600.1 hypothetical protein NQV15_12125 [Aeromicrobium wangtongii]
MLDSGSWSPAVLDELVSIIGVDTATGFMDARAWQRRAPGLLPWTYRHPWLTVFGGVLVTFVLLFVLISLLPVAASS